MRLPKVQFKMRKHRKEAAVNAIASIIPNQEALDLFLVDSTPQMKRAIIARLQPHLPFEPIINA